MKVIQMEVNEGSYVWGEFKLLFIHKDEMEEVILFQYLFV